MSEVLLAAILNAVAKLGIDAVIAFLENRGATIDDAIAALKLARSKALADYVKEDAQSRAVEQGT
jgi:hypothetical protein